MGPLLDLAALNPGFEPILRRRILELPDPLLRETASPVEGDAVAMRALVADMFHTMHAHAGLGLAATQLGIPRRVIVVELPNDDDPQSGIRHVLIDPEISASDARDDMVEGCLSLPGYRSMVERATTITVEFTQLDGGRDSLDAKGLLAQAVQHEIDHLNGVLFIDHLDSLLEVKQIPPDPLDWDEDEDEGDHTEGPDAEAEELGAGRLGAGSRATATLGDAALAAGE